jgi:hypothetical protein
MQIVEYMLLECPIRAPHPRMGRSDWTLLTTSVSPLASSDMYVAIGQVQEYSAETKAYVKQTFKYIKQTQIMYRSTEACMILRDLPL